MTIIKRAFVYSDVLNKRFIRSNPIIINSEAVILNIYEQNPYTRN